MKGLPLLGVVILSSGCVSVSPMTRVGPTDGWREFVSEEGRFAVLLPAAPATSQRAVDSGVLNIFVAEGDDSAYVVVYRDLAADIASQLTADEILDTADDNAAANGEQEVLSFEPIRVAGHPGRSLTIRDARSGTITETRAFLVGSRLYSVGATTARGDLAPANCTRFFESVKILPQEHRR